MNNQNKAYTYAFLAVILWSTAASAFKITLCYIDPIGLLFFSTAVAILTLLIFFLFSKRTKISKKMVFNSAILGFLNPFAYYIILFNAYSLLPAQLAQPINFVWPVMIVLLSIPILKQKISLKSIFSMVISFIGVFVISSRGNFNLDFKTPIGILLALSSSVIWALFFICNVKDKSDEILKLFLSFMFGFIYIAVIFIPKFSIPPWQAIVGSIYIGLFEMGITFVFWIRALKYARTTADVNDIIYITPFISLIFISFLVEEKILPSTIIGLFLIITGIFLQKRKINILQIRPSNS